MIKPELIWRVLRFAVVGGIVMLVFMGLNRLLEPRFGRDRAFLIAYPPALALHFSLNKWWTFGESTRRARRQLGEYAVLVVVTFFIQLAVFKVLSATTSLPGWLDAGLANAAQVAITYIVMQRRIFAPVPAK